MTAKGSGRVGPALHADLALLHGLQQRGLGLGRRPVDLVGQEQAGTPGPAGSGSSGHAGDQLARDVRRHQVGGELEALELEVEGPGHRLHQQGLGHPGDALEQDVTAHEEGGDDARQRALLADDDLGHQHGVDQHGRHRPRLR